MGMDVSRIPKQPALGLNGKWKAFPRNRSCPVDVPVAKKSAAVSQLGNLRVQEVKGREARPVAEAGGELGVLDDRQIETA